MFLFGASGLVSRKPSKPASHSVSDWFLAFLVGGQIWSKRGGDGLSGAGMLERGTHSGGDPDRRACLLAAVSLQAISEPPESVQLGDDDPL